MSEIPEIKIGLTDARKAEIDKKVAKENKDIDKKVAKENKDIEEIAEEMWSVMNEPSDEEWDGKIELEREKERIAKLRKEKGKEPEWNEEEERRKAHKILNTKSRWDVDLPDRERKEVINLTQLMLSYVIIMVAGGPVLSLGLGQLAARIIKLLKIGK